MIRIVIPETEYWDEGREVFLRTKRHVLNLEHSLLSVSKWESKWHKPFLGEAEKTPEEFLDYIRCMTVGEAPEEEAYWAIPVGEMDRIEAYIKDDMTATWFSEKEGKGYKGRGQTVTNELIYYWMVALEIPFSCEKWHLNRLLTLIRVCNEQNAPKKKMSKRDIMMQNHALNQARKAKLHSRG